MNGFITSLIVITSVYAVLALSLDLMLGHAKIYASGHAAFFGLGAYAAALMGLHVTSEFLPSLLVATVVGGLAGIILALPAMRANRVIYVVSSLAIGVIFFEIFNSWTAVTGGPSGLVGIPYPTLFGLKIDTNDEFIFLAVGLVLVAAVLSKLLIASPLGRRVHAIRDDHIAAQALGMRHNLLRLVIVVIACGLATWGGVLYAYFVSFVSPETFSPQQSVLIAAMVVVGGSTTIVGPLIGAAVLTVVPQLLQYLQLAPAVTGPVEQILYGLLLLAVVMIRPGGLISFIPWNRLRARKAGKRRSKSGPGGTSLDSSEDEIRSAVGSDVS